MKEKNSQVNGDGADAPLDASPFAQLLGRFPEGPAPSEDKAVVKKPVLAFRVGRTKKGGYPIFLEKRPGGKSMTIIRNVSGDAEALLHLLKKRCAAGGKAFDDWVEVQGDQSEKVQALLRELGL